MVQERNENNASADANVADKAAKEAMVAMNDLRTGEFGDAAQNAGDAAVYGGQAMGQMAADAVENVTRLAQNQPAQNPTDLPGE